VTDTTWLDATAQAELAANGPARNPYDVGRSTVAPAADRGAAVAAGLVPVAHSSDGGGSIRIPAGECGLIGLKPTRARVSQGPDIGESWAGATTPVSCFAARRSRRRRPWWRPTRS
jgi:amidase